MERILFLVPLLFVFFSTSTLEKKTPFEKPWVIFWARPQKAVATLVSKESCLLVTQSRKFSQTRFPFCKKTKVIVLKKQSLILKFEGKRFVFGNNSKDLLIEKSDIVFLKGPQNFIKKAIHSMNLIKPEICLIKTKVITNWKTTSFPVINLETNENFIFRL